MSNLSVLNAYGACNGVLYIFVINKYRVVIKNKALTLITSEPHHEEEKEGIFLLLSVIS